ncbi:MAG: phage tail protein [Roseiflexaceae bacterium]
MPQDIYSSSRFYVMIDSMAQAVFTELSGLQVETEVMEYAEGGNNDFVHRLPGRTRVGNITLKRGITSSNDLFKWYMAIASGRKIDRRNISLVMYDTAGVELMRWNFLSAYPVKWVGPQFDATGNVSAVETLELAHAGLQMG